MDGADLISRKYGGRFPDGEGAGDSLGQAVIVVEVEVGQALRWTSQ